MNAPRWDTEITRRAVPPGTRLLTGTARLLIVFIGVTLESERNTQIESEVILPSGDIAPHQVGSRFPTDRERARDVHAQPSAHDPGELSHGTRR